MILRLGVIDLVDDLEEADPRVLFLDLAQLGPGIVVGGDFGRALRALDVEADHLPPVHLGDGALLRIGVLDRAEVGEANRASARNHDVGLRQIVGGSGIAEHAYRLLRTGDLGAAAGGVEICLAQLLVDLRGGDALRLQRGRIEHHADVALDSALAGDCGDAFDPEHPARNIIVDVPRQLLECHVGGFGGNEQDRIAGKIDPRDLWLEDAVRQVAADLGDGVAQIVDRTIGRCADLELDKGLAVALTDRAVDFVHPVDRARRRLDLLGDLIFHLGRRRAGL